MAQLNLHSNEQTRTLFPLKGEIRIVELKEDAARMRSDHLKALSGFVSTSQPMYPDIERWLAEKVIPGLKSSERIAYVAYENEKPIASAILKLGNRSKFCHVRVHEDFQDRDLGQIFFTLMTLKVRHLAKQIHFTLPESLWCERSEFFRSFGFSGVAKAQRQYRHGDTELICSAPYSVVWSAVKEKLPALVAKFTVGGYSLNNKILMSIQPKYAEKVLAGEKMVEIRRKFSKKWTGCKAVLYASRPVSALVGVATVRSVTSGPPDQIWWQFGESIGCSRGEFDAYSASANQVCAIELDEIVPYLDRVPLDQLTHLMHQDLKPPQSYCELNPEKNNAWATAVSIASLLHGHRRSATHRFVCGEEANDTVLIG